MNCYFCIPSCVRTCQKQNCPFLMYSNWTLKFNGSFYKVSRLACRSSLLVRCLRLLFKMNRSSSESSEVGHSQEEDGFVSRLRNIPVVKSAVSQASSIYTKAKEANAMTKLSLSLAEMSIKAAVESTKFAYSVVPMSGFVGTLKEQAEKKVGEADALACKGLDLLEERYPVITSEPQEILSVGADKIEKSDIIEAALIVSEAALDYINPAGTKKEMNGNVKPKVVSNKKIDRMIDVSRRTGMGIYRGGSKIVWNTATAPWYATKTGLNLACQAAAGAAHLTSDVISIIPGVSGLVPPRRKLRRSRRRRNQRKQESNESPFPVSPEKKRKRSNGENNSEDETLYEMLYVKEYYASDEDPDYCPKDDESNSEGDSSDTVGASDEEGDSGEGDEVDISEAGGQSLTAEQAKKSVKFAGGHIAHGPQGSLVVHVVENKRSTEVHMMEKEDQKLASRPGIHQGVAKDRADAIETKKEEKSAKSPELKTVKSPKTSTRAKNYAAAVGKENVPKSPSEKTAAVADSALKAGEKPARPVKSPADSKDPRATKEGAKNTVPPHTADSNANQKEDPFKMKGRIIL